MVVITPPNIEGTDSWTIEAQWFTFPLLFQTAFLVIVWSQHHSEIVCEKGNSNGKDSVVVMVPCAKERHVAG